MDFYHKIRLAEPCNGQIQQAWLDTSWIEMEGRTLDTTQGSKVLGVVQDTH
jgi:hypothetical protein